MGIKIGMPLNLSDCPVTYNRLIKETIVDEDKVRETDGVCIDRKVISASDIVHIRNTPRININYNTIVSLKNGIVDRIRIDFEQKDFHVFSESFKKRYGNPTYTETASATTGSGAILDSKILSWEGDSIVITMFERLVKINQSIISISNPKKQKELNNDEASKF